MRSSSNITTAGGFVNRKHPTAGWSNDSSTKPYVFCWSCILGLHLQTSTNVAHGSTNFILHINGSLSLLFFSSGRKNIGVRIPLLSCSSFYMHMGTVSTYLLRDGHLMMCWSIQDQKLGLVFLGWLRTLAVLFKYIACEFLLFMTDTANEVIISLGRYVILSQTAALNSTTFCMLLLLLSRF